MLSMRRNQRQRRWVEKHILVRDQKCAAVADHPRFHKSTPTVSVFKRASIDSSTAAGSAKRAGRSYSLADHPWEAMNSQRRPTRDKPSEGLESLSTHSNQQLRDKRVRRVAAA